MKKTALILIVCALLLSCGQSKSEKNEQQEALVELNNNERWKANPETTQGIYSMQQLTDEFQHSENIEQYVELKKELEKSFAEIINKCTMKGEAHDRLHDYLMPIKNYMDELDASDAKEAKETLLKLKNHLSQYDNYFE